MSKDEIKVNIADGTIFAVSVDTAVFDKYSCNLDSKVLNKLSQRPMHERPVLPLRIASTSAPAGTWLAILAIVPVLSAAPIALCVHPALVR